MSRASSAASLGSMRSRAASSNSLNGTAHAVPKEANVSENTGDTEALLISPKPRQQGGGGNPSIVVKGTDTGTENLPKVKSRRLWGLSRPEWKWVMLALIMAVVNGCTFPAYSLLLSNIVSYLYDPDTHVVREKGYFWAGMGCIS